MSAAGRAGSGHLSMRGRRALPRGGLTARHRAVPRPGTPCRHKTRRYAGKIPLPLAIPEFLCYYMTEKAKLVKNVAVEAALYLPDS